MSKKKLSEIIGQMCEQDLDIRSSTTLVEAKTTKQGGVVTMGVDRETVLGITSEMISGNKKYYTILLVLNKEQYDKIDQGD